MRPYFLFKMTQLIRHDVNGVMSNSSFLRRCVGALSFPEEKLAHGHVIYEASEHVKRTMAPENYLLRYRCSAGYTLKGHKNIACVGNKWTHKVPTCLSNFAYNFLLKKRYR
ncbi:hypothetical protein CEXT_32211 [Caerostris extrusa]|uniref:Sushi domain-containing protein n=1 Tax=Caerostris extrusa TaxID=172846 RepID=A0AAV4YET4_CAEEX|nr:hypothetical protein CEXT_32211 [Caerostris extrusa]